MGREDDIILRLDSILLKGDSFAVKDLCPEKWKFG